MKVQLFGAGRDGGTLRCHKEVLVLSVLSPGQNRGELVVCCEGLLLQIVNETRHVDNILVGGGRGKEEAFFSLIILPRKDRTRCLVVKVTVCA